MTKLHLKIKGGCTMDKLTDVNSCKNLLQSLIDSDIISETAVVEKINAMTKKDIKKAVISTLGEEPKIYPYSDNKRIFTKVKICKSWKNVYAWNTDELYSKLYKLLHGDANITLAGLFPRFMLYRRDMNKVSPKTIQENKNDWDKFIKDKPIVNIPMHKLKPKDYITLFENITKNGTLTSKRVSNIKSLLNKMYDYAIREELVDSNPIHSVPFSEFNYYVPDNSDKVYTQENRIKLLTYLQNIVEPYALAIQLDFQLTCRISEIKALTWEDIDFENRSISIQKQALRHQQMNDDLSFSSVTTEVVPRVKGNKKTGKRCLYMTDEAYRILKLAQEINPDGEYIFMPFGRIMSTYTFNQNLKRYCEQAKVPYFSSHIIRFTSCSNLYNASQNLAGTSKAMGHSQVATTMHYLRNVCNNSDIQNHMEQAFKVCNQM